MFNIYRKELDWGGRKLVLETGRIARQADGAVLATYGGTTVLAAVVFEKQPKPGLDFFPLTVNYQEKTFAAGKIPGGFFKREGRPSEKEVLTSRLIDRPIRPLFHESYRNETLVVVTVLAHDLENDPDVVSMIATSAALTISGIPFMGPIGGVRVGYIDGKYVINPTRDQLTTSALDLVVAGTQEGVLMVESQAKELAEDVMLGAVMEGHRSFQPVIEAIIQLAEHCAKEPLPLTDPSEASKTVAAKLKAETRAKLVEAYDETKKQVRQTNIKTVQTDAKKLFEGNDAALAAFGEQFGDLEAEVVRTAVLDTGKRIDGRDTKTVRPIVAEVGVLPRAHGSQGITVHPRRDPGSGRGDARHRPGRADHRRARGRIPGKLHAALQLPSVLGGRSAAHGLARPPRDRPRQARLARSASDDAGQGQVPLHRARGVGDHREQRLLVNGLRMRRRARADGCRRADGPVQVAGIAMGLIKEGEDFAVLSDILGDEDHLGDMDFKVAGTANGITALQMDIKITSITEEIMKVALGQAKEGRIHILGEMAKGLGGARESVSQNAPRITQFTIPKATRSGKGDRHSGVAR